MGVSIKFTNTLPKQTALADSEKEDERGARHAGSVRVVQAKQPLSIGPHLGGIESRALGKLAELLDAVFVGVFRVDGLALGERYRRAVEANSLGPETFDVHFDPPKPLRYRTRRAENSRGRNSAPSSRFIRSRRLRLKSAVTPRESL